MQKILVTIAGNHSITTKCLYNYQEALKFIYSFFGKEDDLDSCTEPFFSETSIEVSFEMKSPSPCGA